MLIIVVCLIVGVLLGYIVNFDMTTVTSVYMALAILAAFDTIMGGIVANINKQFSLSVFISGFFGNALLAIIIIYLGSRLGLDLYIGVVIVFVIRIFQNFSIIRRFLLNKLMKSDRIDNNNV